MTVRKVNKLIKIAQEYKMYPLVYYYELKKDYIRLENEFDKYKSEQYQRTGYGGSMNY